MTENAPIADAPGVPAAESAPGIPGGPLGLLTAKLDPELVRGALRDVIDPELGVNIVDLGLVYEIEIEDGEVLVVMTLTTPGCPLGGYLEDEILYRLNQLPQVRQVAVRIVWEPAWGPEMMSDAARAQLGWGA